MFLLIDSKLLKKERSRPEKPRRAPAAGSAAGSFGRDPAPAGRPTSGCARRLHFGEAGGSWSSLGIPTPTTQAGRGRTEGARRPRAGGAHPGDGRGKPDTQQLAPRAAIPGYSNGARRDHRLSGCFSGRGKNVFQNAICVLNFLIDLEYSGCLGQRVDSIILKAAVLTLSRPHRERIRLSQNAFPKILCPGEQSSPWLELSGLSPSPAARWEVCAPL